MTRPRHNPRHLAALLLPLLAASLACNALGGAGSPVGARLTHAAATVTAARPAAPPTTAPAATGASSGVVIYALPGSQSQAFLNQFVPSLKSSGVNVDPALVTKFNQDTAAGDTVAAVNDLVAMTANQPKYRAHQVNGIGSVA